MGNGVDPVLEIRNNARRPARDQKRHPTDRTGAVRRSHQRVSQEFPGSRTKLQSLGSTPTIAYGQSRSRFSSTPCSGTPRVMPSLLSQIPMPFSNFDSVCGKEVLEREIFCVGARHDIERAPEKVGRDPRGGWPGRSSPNAT